MVFLSSFLPCVKWVSTSLTPAARLWPFLLLCMMEAVKSCAVTASPQRNYSVKQNHKSTCLDGELYFSSSFSKSTGWGCYPNYYLSYKFLKNSVRFEFHALCVLASMGCCSNEGAFNALKSHPFLSGCKFHSEACFIALKLQTYDAAKRCSHRLKLQPQKAVSLWHFFLLSC